MVKTVSATEAKARLGALLSQAAQKETIIIAMRGKPKAVILSFEEYTRMKRLEEEARRRERLARLEALGKKIRSRGVELTEEEAEELAERFSRETIEELIASGHVRYQGD